MEITAVAVLVECIRQVLKTSFKQEHAAPLHSSKWLCVGAEKQKDF